ncbi:MAG TPA: hypothetical protein VGO26_04365 [Amnibacterium sp.]|jgi:hypothetical protein|nr:hypothetical protein [Amnibacterium sp.]
MPARTRDAIVVAVLVVAAFGAALAWHPLGRWAALLIALAGLLGAAGVYRVRRPAFPLRGEREIPDEPPGLADTTASTRRPS